MLVKTGWFITRLFVAVLVFNWIIAEVDTFVPGVKGHTLAVLELIEIPTHREVFADGMPSFSDVGVKIDSFIADWDFEDFQSDFQQNLLDKIESSQFDFDLKDKSVGKIKLASFVTQNLNPKPSLVVR